MIDQFIAQLRDNNPDRRRQAIIALGKSLDPAAMPHLANVYRTDPDPALRELARKAGLHIRQHVETNRSSVPRVQPFVSDNLPTSAADDVDEPDLDALTGRAAPRTAKAPAKTLPPPPPPPPKPEPAPQAPPSAPEPAQTVPVRGREYSVSRENVQRSKQYVEEALSLNMRRDNAKAMKALAHALELNPNLVNDAYFGSIAGSVTGLEGDGAIQMILDSQQRKGFVKQELEKKKQDRIEKHLTEARSVTWSSTIFEIVLFTIITAAGPIVAMLVTVESARAFLTSLPPEFARTSQGQSLIAMLDGYNVGGLVVSGIISGIVGVLSLLLQTVFIHYSATLLLRGHGTLRYLLELLLSFYNKWLPIIFFISYIAIAVGFASGGSPVILCIVLPLIFLSLYVSGKTSGKIGEAYDFGTGKGCLAYLFGIIIFAILSVVLALLIGQPISAALQNLIAPL